MAKNNTTLLAYISGIQKSEQYYLDSTQGVDRVITSEGFAGRVLFQLLEDACILWPMARSSIFKHGRVASPFLSDLCFCPYII